MSGLEPEPFLFRVSESGVTSIIYATLRELGCVTIRTRETAGVQAVGERPGRDRRTIE
jgi:hypothetical protein